MTTATRRRRSARAPARQASAAQVQATADPARSLRETTVGVRLAFSALGVRRVLRRDQLRRAQAVFEAADGSLSASKRLLNTRHPAWRAVMQAKRRLVGYWRSVTLPYPESAVRLLRRDWIERFEAQAEELKTAMNARIVVLNGAYPELLAAARGALGELYDHGDYPPSLAEEFAVRWEYVTLEPPDYLAKLKPELYAQEAARVAAQFDQAVVLAEQAFAAEFAGLVEAITRQLAPAPDGRQREVRPRAVASLREFFDRFRELNVHGSAELDTLIDQARAAVEGAGLLATDPDAGRARERIARSLVA
ncbi:MAG TPA: hypothetical protein VMW52_10480, partial [Phycisphaerae bacterium]|nr:hypothetical protein [Phycisphaerae bacterium]